MESVKEIFTEEDAKLISSIHLSKVNMPDRLIWRDSESGELSVKTGYIVARKVLGKDTTPDTSWKEVWCVIWKAVVAPKVKLFAWRLIQGFIPVWSILISRGIQVHNCCCMCASCGETVWHVFFDCKFSKEVWKLFNIEAFNFIVTLWRFNDGWARLILWLKDKDLVEKWLYVMWSIWFNRNQCLHKQFSSLPADLVRKASRMQGDFGYEMTRNEKVETASATGWKKPPSGSIKLNVDAAFATVVKEARLGLVIRDSRGEVLWSAVKRVDQVYSPLQAELLAILFGLEEIAGFTSQDVEVESDSLLAISEVKNINNSSCEWEGISMDI